MHELGIICEVIKTVDNIAIEQNIDKVDTIVLEVGELSGMVPLYIKECFPAVVWNKPRFVDTKLVIEEVKGEAKCDNCGTVFNVVQNEGYCPNCKCFDKLILSGREFIIKEILVP